MVSWTAESEKWDGETGREWHNESRDYCYLWVSAMPAISIVDHRCFFPSLPPIPLLTDVTINDHLLRLSLFLSSLYIPSLASPSPFPHFFLPLTTLPLLFPPFCFPYGLGWVEFNAPPHIIEVISEAVFRANHLLILINKTVQENTNKLNTNQKK